MDLMCTAAVILFLTRNSFCVPGDPVMYFPPLEVRAAGQDNREIMFPFANAQFQPMNQQMPQQHPILHTGSVPSPAPTTPAPQEKPNEMTNHNFTFNEFVEALNQVSEQKEEASTDHSRTAGRDDYGQPPYPSYPPYPRPYGYPTRPSNYGPYGSYGSYGPYSPPSYHEPAAYVPPTTVHHSASKTLKPDLGGLLKPVTAKVSSKISGLIGLVLTLLTGSSPDDLEMKGFKDIVINGIVKPLLIAKGGIKSLISKLAIPVISLLLINLEVLITIWWLWEDCPEPVRSPPVYPYPKPVYSYR